MPTGYTAEVASGEMTEFPDFVKRCARGMGALIGMRDLPLDAPFPDRIEADLAGGGTIVKALKKLAQS